LSTGVTVRVAIAGAADALPIVMLHGWGCSMYMHRTALTVLPSHGFRVIAPDLRGHGLSDKPTHPGAYDTNAFVDDLLSLLDVLGLARVILLGQSLGGAVALHAALRAPERITSLVLVNPIGLTPAPIRNVARFISPAFAMRHGPQLVRRWMIALIMRWLVYTDRSRMTETDVDEYWAPSQFPEHAYAARAAFTEFDWTPIRRDRLRSLRMPVLMVVGRSDRLIRGVARAGEAIPDVRLVTMRGGHAVNEEFGQEVCDEILRFTAAQRRPVRARR
jgi:pimeloyl-ACP methyl ester carboxylesterase